MAYMISLKWNRNTSKTSQCLKNRIIAKKKHWYRYGYMAQAVNMLTVVGFEHAILAQAVNMSTVVGFEHVIWPKLT